MVSEAIVPVGWLLCDTTAIDLEEGCCVGDGTLSTFAKSELELEGKATIKFTLPKLFGEMVNRR